MKTVGTQVFIIKPNNMETIIDIIMWFFLASTILIGFLILGEAIASRNKKSKFYKWWREKVVSDKPYDSY